MKVLQHFVSGAGAEALHQAFCPGGTPKITAITGLDKYIADA